VLLPGLGPGGIEVPQARLQALLCALECLLSCCEEHARFASDMTGDEGGGWNCSAPEPSGRGQGIPMGESLFNIFFLARNRAGGLSWSAVVKTDGTSSDRGK